MSVCPIVQFDMRFKRCILGDRPDCFFWNNWHSPETQDKDDFAGEISIEQIVAAESDFSFCFTFASGDRSELDKATA